MHVLGIDAGGTKSICLLADERGEIVSMARGPGANLHAAGELGVEKVLHELMETAIGDRDVTPGGVCGHRRRRSRGRSADGAGYHAPDRP